MAALCRLAIRELCRRISAGELTAQSLAEDAIRCRQRLEPVLAAYHQHHDQALLQAASELDTHGCAADSTVAGVPVSLKSAFGIDGYDCYAGAAQPLPASLCSQGPVVSHLRQRGALLTGTTHAAELSVGGLGVNAHWGTPRNPWDARHYRVPGGSSAGAPVSVWEGSCAFALGGDTGGSVRVPASLCGLVGFKTSDARWPVAGLVPLASRFDTVGVMALRVDDVLQVVRCLDEPLGEDVQRQSAQSLTLSDFQFRRASALCWESLEPGIADAIEQALYELCAQGMQLSADDGGLYADAAVKRDQGPNTAAVELRQLLQEKFPELLPRLSAHVAQFLESARTVSDQAYQTRVQLFGQWRCEVHQRMTDNEIIVLPTVRASAPTLQQIEDKQQYEHYSDALLHNTVLPSFNGCCAITLPVGLDAAGVPVGLQLVARAGAEYRLLRAAALIEQRIGNVLERLGEPPLCQSTDLHRAEDK